MKKQMPLASRERRHDKARICATRGGCSSNGESFEESSMHFSDGRYGLDQITGLGIGMPEGLLNMLISAQNPNRPPGPPEWQYSQSTGSMDLKVGAVTIVHAGKGYAGHGKGLNNPASQSVSEDEDKANAGPLVRTIYTIGPPINSKLLGPVSMHLTPAPGTNMEGRGANSFWMHGENSHKPPLSSSEGCIVISRPSRETVAGSGIEVLIVVH